MTWRQGDEAGRARPPRPGLTLLQTRLGKARDLSVKRAELHSGEAQSPQLHMPPFSPGQLSPGGWLHARQSTWDPEQDHLRS